MCGHDADTGTYTMTQPPEALGGGRMRRDDIAAAIAFALRHLHDLEDLDVLENSPLARTPLIRRRAATSTLLFAAATALRDELIDIVAATLARLPVGRPTDGLQRMRVTLAGVALDGRSIASLATEHGRRREVWSRGPWRRAVALVVDEFIQRNTEAGRTRHPASEATTPPAARP